METKSITKIKLKKEHFNNMVQKEHLREIEELGGKVEKYINGIITSVVSEIRMLLKKQRKWLKIKNKDVFYNDSFFGLIPNLQAFKVGYHDMTMHADYSFQNKEFLNKFAGYEGGFFTYNEFKYSFANSFEFLEKQFDFKISDWYTVCPPLNGYGYYYKDGQNSRDMNQYFYWSSSYSINHNPSHVPVYRLAIDLYKERTVWDTLSILLSEKLIDVEKFNEICNEYLYSWSSYNKTEEKSMLDALQTFEADKLISLELINKIKNLYDKKVPKTAEGTLMILMKNNLVPAGLSYDSEEILDLIKNLVKMDEKLLIIDEDKFVCNKEYLSSLSTKKINDIAAVIDSDSIEIENIAYKLKSASLVVNTEEDLQIMKDVTADLLSCDTIRADIDPYDEKILFDPNRGHWDLFENVEFEENDLTANLSQPLIAKNPYFDVNFDGIIGIDFGTKSSVVVFQKDAEHTMPMRIGTGGLSKEIEASHYENPTVLEFIDFQSFMDAYEEKEGRPNTLWEQLTTSHTAFNSFLNSSSNQYYSFLYELKQWAGDKRRKIKLRDKKGKDIMLSPYLEMEEGDFDPIEIYAYYIGLYINNMHNGIYIDYLLSYPVAYEKSVRDKMIESFSRGIKKSFPKSILDNKEVMDNFRVVISASEPVAYAICALDEFGFDPEDEEKIFYGVFDFGGGTTDFDFGIYREADARETRYDYVVESFGGGGDQYLGGENILEILAFELFKSNQEILRANNITFIRPPECKLFLGGETLISESQEAKLNTAQLMEKMRILWERHAGYQEYFESGVLKVNLFDVKGDQKSNIELAVNIEKLELIIRKRIEKGVRNFFQSLLESFNIPKNLEHIDEFNILLAGNSSKSEILIEIFDEYIDKYNEVLAGYLNTTADKIDHFKVLPPLGSDEAIKIQEANGKVIDEYYLERPTGKTGVAFGLVQSRLGGTIKLIISEKNTEEIKFMFYIGRMKKKKFKMISDREIKYYDWHCFIDASEIDFTLFYSKLPEAKMGELDAKDVLRKKCRLDATYENAFVYYRTITPNTIEYVVATEDGIEIEQYLTSITKLVLEGFS